MDNIDDESWSFKKTPRMSNRVLTQKLGVANLSRLYGIVNRWFVLDFKNSLLLGSLNPESNCL